MEAPGTGRNPQIRVVSNGEARTTKEVRATGSAQQERSAEEATERGHGGSRHREDLAG